MTSLDEPRILVVGAGSLGSLFGGLLAEGGLPVTLLGNSPAHSDAIARAGGLRIVGYGGDRLVPLKATSDVAAVEPPDIVIFLCKAGANTAAATRVRHFFDGRALAISFQNGLGNEDQIGAVIGRGAILAGLTAQGARLEAPGIVRNFTELPSHLGEIAGGPSERAERVAGLFSAHGLPTEASATILRAKWSKLFANIAFSATSGATGLTIGEVGGLPALSETALRAIDEAAEVAAAQGHVFDRDERRHVFNQLLAPTGAGANTTSMYRDLAAGKPSELDAIYGAVIDLARSHGVPVPTLRTLYAIVAGIEAAHRRETRSPGLP
jgi:2-dehydropantoate 2-reductase